MFRSTVTYSTPIGIVAGLLWGTVLGASVTTSLVIGAIAGIALGILLGLYGKAGTIGENVTPAEGMFVIGSMLGLLALLAIGTGLIAWIVRLIFF